MIKSMKIRLLPTKEQEVLMLKTIGCSRFAYNWALNRCDECGLEIDRDKNASINLANYKINEISK